MSEKLQMRYVGPNKELFGQLALIERQDPTSRFLIYQFDNLQLPSRFIYGWNLGASKDFEEVTYG